MSDRQPVQATTDAKARVRAALLTAGALRPVEVSRDDLAEVLRELGELRQVVQQQAKGLRDAGNAALAENRSMGRVFANAAAASALRRCARLERALTEIAGRAPLDVQRIAEGALLDA
jgi:transcription initiation factor TFIIIB Brf1 subunit/transcription initiation factor TFIIB